MSEIDYAQLLRAAWPEIIVVVTALVVLFVDLLLRRSPVQVRFAVAASIACLGCAAAILHLVFVSVPAFILDGVFVLTGLTGLVQIALLALTMVTLLLAVPSTFTKHVGEFVLLVLLATTGMMFLVASQDLLVIFISLELLSLSLYALTGFDKQSKRSSEASLKYFLFGGMSAAFLLFGFSYLYGLSNSTSLTQIASAIHGPGLSPLLILAMVMTVIGFGFKVAAAPFHFWAPDVYEGTPAPSAAFVASGSKVASFFIFFQVMVMGFAGAEGSVASTGLVRGWVPVLVLVAVLSMTLGNLAAIAQTSVRRLLAYSAIAHAGYMLLAIASRTEQSLTALLYYVITYAIATLGAFGVIAIVEAQAGGDSLSDFAGLSRRAPVLSFCLAIFVLSLAGIPPLTGFFAKFYLFVSVLGANPGSSAMLWLVVLAIAMSAVSLYYYLRVLKRVYVTEPSAGTGQIHVPLLSQVVLCILAAAVVVFGCAPHLLLSWILQAVHGPGL
jgi:NADH-quinone oxidoreductase subunit N